MTPDPQLLTKIVTIQNLDVTGETRPVRFNLQRGKIARIWGFTWGVYFTSGGNREYTLFVRKTPNAERSQSPQDILWASILAYLATTAGAAPHESQIMFPKPYRTSGITVQMHCSAGTGHAGLLTIYYDIDDVSRGDLAQRWEKSRTRKYDRRNLAP